MADELAKALAEAKKKMFGNEPSGGKIVILFKGDARIESKDSKVEVQPMP